MAIATGTKYYFQAIGDDGVTRYFAVTAPNQQAASIYIYDNYAVGGLTFTGGSAIPGVDYEEVVIGDTGDTGDGGPISGGDVGTGVLEQDSARAAFMAHLGDIGFDLERGGRRFDVAAEQFGPLSTLFQARELVSGRDPDRFISGMERERAFKDFLGSSSVSGTAGGPGARRGIPTATTNELLRQFEGFEGLAEEPRENLLDFQREAVQPTYPGAGGPVAGLGLAALRQSVSPLALGWYRAPTERGLTDRYLALRENAAPGVEDFVAHVRGQLGLGGFYANR